MSEPPKKGAIPKKPAGRGSRGGPSGSKAVVPRRPNAMNPFPDKPPMVFKKENGMLVPEGYTMRKIEPAKNYDVVSFARAMNPDFAPRLKKLFDPETEAALTAQRTGIYIGWRDPAFKHDCMRLNNDSKCFCGHLLKEHDKYDGKSVRVPCKFGGCPCKAFAWIPARPEEIGEFWHARRRGFDVNAWRAKCKCKHNHEQHDPNGSHRCKMSGCGCAAFFSDFLCAGCDQHWEKHETFFETESERVKNGLPVGEMYIPFAEMPELRNIALTGREDDDSKYLALTQGEGAPPRTQRTIDNNTPVNFGAGSSRGGFRPTYD